MKQEEARLRKEARKVKRRRRRRRMALVALLGAGAAAVLSSRREPAPGSGQVTLADEQPGPLSIMLGEMLKGFLKLPEKKAVADGLMVSIALQDLDNPEMATTLSFKGSDVTVSNGVSGDVDIYIGTELALLLSLSSAGKGMEMIKWLRTEEGKKIIDAVKSGRLRIRGLARNPLQMIQFQKFLTPPA